MAAVPADLGVPPLLTGTLPPTSANLLTGDTVSGLGNAAGAQWGIFLGGAAVVTADTVTSLDFKKEFVLADYQIEGGGFQSYDKVSMPFEPKVRFVAGTSQQNRAQLLSSIDAIAGDLKLYDVVTPEKTYQNCNVRHYDYHRTTANGAGVLAVDVWLLEVRAGSAATVSTQSPSGAAQVNAGSVQAAAPTSAQQTLGAGSN